MNTQFLNCERADVSNGILAVLDGNVDVIEKTGAYAHPQHEGEADWYIVIYKGVVDGAEYFGAGTNGDPVWRDDDTAAWAGLMEEYNINL